MSLKNVYDFYITPEEIENRVRYKNMEGKLC